MKTSLKIFGVLLVVIGIISIIGGMSENNLSVVVGGGLFVALGVVSLKSVKHQ